MRARDNPYRAERLHSLAFRLNETTWESLWERLRHLGGRGCVVGRQGSGKTTLLQDFTEFLRSEGLTVRQRTIRSGDSGCGDAQAPETVAPEEIWILDGADRLNPLQWLAWKRRTRAGLGLIATSHRRRLLPTLYRCRSTPSVLRDLIDELHPGASCGQPSADELFARHRGNLREALRELYDFHAEVRDRGRCDAKDPRPGGEEGAA